MPIGDQPIPELEALARADNAALYGAGVGILASYKALGSLVAIEVRCHVAARVDQGRGGVSPANIARVKQFSVGIPGVGENSVTDLRIGDTLTVPGWAADQPGVSELPLTIKGEIRLVDGCEWNALAAL